MGREVNELYRLSSNFLTSGKKCIFGTGAHARQTYVDLAVQGIKIDFFVDREASRLGDSYMGLPLMDEEELNGQDVTVVIASTSWKDIADRLIRLGVTDLYVDRRRYGEVEVREGRLCSIGRFPAKNDTLYILCPAGIGDTLFVAAYAKAVKKSHPAMRRLCLITKESHACIGELFDGVDEVLASNQLVEQLDLYSIATKTWHLKNYIYGHFKKNLCQTFDVEWYCDTDKNMLSFYRRKILRIPQESKLEEIKIPYSRKAILPEIEKAVILMPYAATAPLMPNGFWEGLAENIIHEGYTVYTNVKDETECPVPGTRRLRESISDTVSICSKAYAAISLRSGMCDILAMTKVPLVVLNTDESFALDWDITRNIRKENIENLCCYGEYSINEIRNKISLFLEKIGKKNREEEI